MAEAFWPSRPVILEHEHYGSSKKRGAWKSDRLLQAVEEYHASYLSIHWWPQEFLQKERPVIEKINRRLGYRLELRRISWPEAVKIREPFTVKSTWANTGVAPCYPGGYMTLTLKDKKGGIVAVLTDSRVTMRELKVGPPRRRARRNPGEHPGVEQRPKPDVRRHAAAAARHVRCVRFRRPARRNPPYRAPAGRRRRSSPLPARHDHAEKITATGNTALYVPVSRRQTL